MKSLFPGTWLLFMVNLTSFFSFLFSNSSLVSSRQNAIIMQNCSRCLVVVLPYVELKDLFCNELISSRCVGNKYMYVADLANQLYCESQGAVWWIIGWQVANTHIHEATCRNVSRMFFITCWAFGFRQMHACDVCSTNTENICGSLRASHGFADGNPVPVQLLLKNNKKKFRTCLRFHGTPKGWVFLTLNVS